MNARRWAPILPVVVAIAGCVATPADLPTGAILYCASDGECPAGWVCREAVGRCFSSEGLDETPPGLDGDASLDASVLGLGRAVTLTFTADEPLALAPAVTLGDADGDPFTFTSTSPSSSDGPPGAGPFTFTYTATGTEPVDAPLAVRVTLLDESGLESALEVGELSFDFTAPALAGDVVIAPTFVRAGVDLEIGLELSEVLGAPPVGHLRSRTDPVGGAAYTLATLTTDGASHQLRYTPTGDEEEGAYVVSVEVADGAGNVASFDLGEVTLDFTPPDLRAGLNRTEVSYEVGPGNAVFGLDMFEAQAAAVGTVVELRFRSDEDIDTTAVVDVWIDNAIPNPEAPGVGDLVFMPVDEAVATEQRFVVEAEVTPAVLLPNGEHTPRVAFQDLAGNRVVRDLDATVHLRAQRPGLVIDQTAIVYVRSPFPVGAAEQLGPDVLVPPPDAQGAPTHMAPYSALMPGDPVAGLPGIPEAALQHDDGSVVLGAFISLDPMGQVVLGGLPRLSSNPLYFERAYLPILPADRVYLSGIDVAGNVTAPVLVENVEWVAHPGVGSFGTVSSLYAQSHATGSLLPPDDTVTSTAAPVADPSPLSWVDGAPGVLVASTGARLEPIDSAGLTPLPAPFAGLTYDLSHGQVVLFGGGAEGSDLERTWAFRDHRFSDVTPLSGGSSPSPRDTPSLAFDRARGRTLLFGGSILGFHLPDDTWEHDGETWVQVGAGGPRPPGRFLAGMVYDAAREVVVLYGGARVDGGEVSALEDLWEWNGNRWTEVPKPTVGPWPGPRVIPRMGYDEVREVVVLYRGEPSASYTTFPPAAAEADTVWEYDGSTWTAVDPAGNAPAPIQMPFWHPGLERVTSLEVAADLTWRLRSWTGSAWETGAALDGPEVPLARVLSSTFYDAAERELVLLGGQFDVASSPGDQQAVWTYGPAGAPSPAWRRIDARPTALPSPRTLAAMALDRGRDTVVLLGGSMTPPLGALDAGHASVWELDGTWEETLEAGTWPESRVAASAAFEPTSGQVLYFGGLRDPNPDDMTPPTFASGTWLYDGASWTDVAPITSPPPTASPAMATDPVFGAVMFGGGNTLEPLSDDTWRFANGDWTLLAPPTSPPGRALASMAYDPVRDVVVLFGGAGDASYFGDTWEWDGTTWTEVGAPGPAARAYHALAYDERRGQVVLTGGLGDVGFFPEIWTYDEDGWERISADVGTPVIRWAHTAAYDPVRRTTVVQGGMSENIVLQSGTYALTPPDVDAAPGVTFVANAQASGVPPAAVTSVRLRARCGADYAPYGSSDVGAALYVWQSRSLTTTGGWIEPAAFGGSRTASGPGEVLDLIDVVVDDPAFARGMFLGRDGVLVTQCRPIGSAGDGRARVAGSFVEVRVRYTHEMP